MGIWDWLVVAVYFIFVLLIGVVCKKMNRNSSDFFRGGGQMFWWLSGITSMMAGLSLWTFSAAGVRVYQTGIYQILSYFIGLLFIPLLYFVFAPRFRRMRVVTSADAIRRRYGKFSAQVWVWSSVPIGIFYSGMALHIIAVFVAGILGLPILWTGVVLGTVIMLMSFSGGAWAVSVSNFLQAMVTFAVVGIVCVKVFLLPEVGGVSGFIAKLPPELYNFDSWSRPVIYIPLLVLTVVGGFLGILDINGAGSSYLAVKNDSNARKQVLLGIAGPFVPLLVFLPIMACKWVIPDLTSVLPELGEKATEGAYAAIAMKVLPTGMIGLLLSALFAVQMSTLDYGLNKNAGFMVCNFYRDILRPQASEKELLIAGRIMTLFFGMAIILIGLTITKLRTLDLFQFSMLFATILQMPMVVPMAMGTVIRKTPPWSAWVTLIFGMVVGALVNLWLLRTPLEIEMFAQKMGLSMPLKPLEVWDFRFIIGWISVIGISFLIYFGSMVFWKYTKPEDKEEIDRFFEDMRTPIPEAGEEIQVPDAENTAPQEEIGLLQYKVVGALTASYGGIIMLGILIPNTWSNRLLFLIGGGAIFCVGAVLLYEYWKKKQKSAGRISPIPGKTGK